MENPRKFAVFDIDGTLIRWQLFHAIVHHLGKHGHIPASTHRMIVDARMVWKNRHSHSSFREYERKLVTAYCDALTEIDPSSYAVIVDEVFDTYKDQTFVYTRDLVRSLKHEGYLLFAISGSQTEIVQKLASYHGFDDSIGAVLEQKDGRFTGHINTPVHDKTAAVQKLVQKHGATFQGSIAVGDTESDSPMLCLVERPIAFNPSVELFERAKEKGWRIVIERKNVVYELEDRDGTYVLV